MKTILLPKILLNPVYVAGLRQPLSAIADVLDEQDKPEYARALRDSATIAEVFADINLLRTARLATTE